MKYSFLPWYNSIIPKLQTERMIFLRKDEYWSIDRLLPKIQSSFAEKQSRNVPISSLGSKDADKHYEKVICPKSSRVIRYYKLTKAEFPKNNLILEKASEEKKPFVPCSLFSPTVLSLNKEQRAFFFYFCSQIEQKRKIETSFSYIVLYLCRRLREIELLKSVPNDIFWLWETYREEFPLADKLFADTVSDFCFYKGITIPFEQVGRIVCEKNFTIRPFLLDPYIFDFLFAEDHKLTPEEINFLIRTLSGDGFRKTKAYRTNSTYAMATEEAMHKAFVKGLFNKKSLNESLFRIQIPSQVHTTRKLFSALPAAETPQIEINLCYLPLLHDNNIHDRCEEILKYLDNRIRAILKIKNALSRIHVSIEHRAFLEEILNDFQHLAPVAENEITFEAAKPRVIVPARKIEVDTAKAAQIEEDSWILTQKLTESYEIQDGETVTLGENTEQDLDEMIEKDLSKSIRENFDPDRGEFWEFAALLSPEEDLFMCYCVNLGKDKAREYALSIGMFYEGMVSTCNEKALSATGDAIMTPFGEIYPEYLSDLKEVFPDMKGETK